MQTKILFFDIDGTLVSFNTHVIPTSTLEAIHEARRKGLKVYIATGRPLPFIDNLGELEYDGMITVTGAHCFTRDGHIIFHHCVDRDDIGRLIELQHTMEQPFPIFFAHEEGIFTTGVNADTIEIGQLLHIKMPQILPIETALEKNVTQVIAFVREEEESAIMQNQLRHCTSMRWHPYFTDIIAQGVSKAEGIDRVLEYEGLKLEESMAFGDGGNDISMLSHAGIGVAMGNASPEVQSYADYVTADVDSDGIRKALEHFGIL